MDIAKRVAHSAQSLSGKAKVHLGRLTKDRDLQARGRADQTTASVKRQMTKGKEVLKRWDRKLDRWGRKFEGK